MKKLISIVFILLFFAACAGMKPTTSSQVYTEVNLINKDLPQRIGSNTILESVTFDESHSVLVCHFTVDTWNRPHVVAEIQSLNLFCDGVEQEYRDHLFSMVKQIEYEYKTADGWIQYEFVADKDTCNGVHN